MLPLLCDGEAERVAEAISRVQTERVDDARSGSEEFAPVGEAVCWLENVCEECGALIESELPAACWRCGAAVVPR